MSEPAYISPDGTVRLYLGDCRDVLPHLDPVHAVVSDPPYGLSFMGKGWDHGVPGEDFWRAMPMLPGAHLLAFGGTRTYHRLACAIEDAGFEIRDCLMWIYGSGFPKSHNLDGDWKGWGTALKPAYEPVIMARRPLIGTVAANVLAHGTGAINVDGCRVETDDGDGGNFRVNNGQSNGCTWGSSGAKPRISEQHHAGRWPANVIHDGSEEAVAGFPDCTPATSRTPSLAKGVTGFGAGNNLNIYQDATRSAARFFYCAKASKRDRDEGCERNAHPTVKPTDLMRYLCRLVTPPRGTVLDPFMGSGSTGKAAILEGFSFVGIEKEPEYLDIAIKRIEWAMRERGKASGAQLFEEAVA